MKQIIDEYGGAMLALVASLGILALLTAVLLRPGSAVSQGIEAMTDGYLSDRLDNSKDAMAARYAMAPLQLQVAQSAVAGRPMALKDLFCKADGTALSLVRLLNDGEGQWEEKDGVITFPKQGMYCMRVYGADGQGNDGSSYLWMAVGKESV
ncbi:MAG: hypothetical protein K6A05_07360 [Lachnospiraceae bacterium]|nr:hypothetical protein [Lachnospiraceae bacterium]